MTSSIEITHINAPDDVSFERLVEILLAAFAFQDDIVDPPSSAKSVSVSELQWRFARDTLLVARDGSGRDYHGISRQDLDVPVVPIGNAHQSGGGLPLAAGGHNNHLLWW